MITFKIIYKINNVKKCLYVDSHTGSYADAMARHNIAIENVVSVKEVFAAPIGIIFPGSS